MINGGLHIKRKLLSKPFFLLFLAQLLLLTLIACASSEGLVNNFRQFHDDSEPAWPPPPQQARIKFLRTISGPSDMGIKKSWLKKSLSTLFGERKGLASILRPYGIFVDSERICVTDPGISAVHIFNITKKTYFQIRKYNGKKLVSPIGIAADKYALYITDSSLRKVFVFDIEGNYLREIGTPDILMRPTGIAVSENRIYVIDTYGNKIYIFSKNDGTLLSHFGKNGVGPGEFHYPTNIFIGRDGDLYVTDSLNFRIQIFDREGNFISGFGRHGDAAGSFSKPKGIAVDSDGNIYVADAEFDNIQIFDRYGNLLLFFGNTGRKKGEMVLPAGLFIDDMDRIYVADSYNKRIQIFKYLKGGE